MTAPSTSRTSGRHRPRSTRRSHRRSTAACTELRASTSAVTFTLRVTPLVLPVVKEERGPPYDSDCAPVHVSEPLHVDATLVTSIVCEEPGPLVTVSVSVAESAPPVAGMLQLERSNLTNAHSSLPDFGETASVVDAPKLELAFCAST